MVSQHREPAITNVPIACTSLYGVSTPVNCELAYGVSTPKIIMEKLLLALKNQSNPVYCNSAFSMTSQRHWRDCTVFIRLVDDVATPLARLQWLYETDTMPREFRRRNVRSKIFGPIDFSQEQFSSDETIIPSFQSMWDNACVNKSKWLQRACNEDTYVPIESLATYLKQDYRLSR